MVGVLECIRGPKKGEIFELNKQQIKIGRASDNDITIFDRTVSSYHATIIFQNGNYIIKDHSTCGTHVNGKQISFATLTLSPGDEVEIGPVTFKFNIKEKIQIDKTIVAETQPTVEKTIVKEIPPVKEKKLEIKEKKKKNHRLVVYGGAFAVIIGMVFYALVTTQQQPPPPPHHPQQSIPNNVVLVNISEEWQKFGSDTIYLTIGKRFYENKTIELSNRYKAIKVWEEAIDSIKNPENKERLRNIIATVDAEITTEWRKLMSEAYAAYKRKTDEAIMRAESLLREALELVPPDEKDKRRQEIKERILEWGLKIVY